MRQIRKNLSLDRNKAFDYRIMVESIIRKDGPSKSKVSLTVKEGAQHPITAAINPENWNVDFVLRDGLAFAPNKALMHFLDKLHIPDPFEEMLRDVSKHEIGHWELPKNSGFGCPYDKPTYYASFIEPIHDELSRTGRFSENYCKQMSMRLANAVTDVINNYNVSQTLLKKGKPFSGQTLFWQIQGQEVSTYSEEYTLFVKLNLAIFGTKQDKKLLSGFMDESREIGDDVKTLSRAFNPDNIYSRDRWEGLAREYARRVAKYLDESAEMPMPQYSPDDETATPGGGGGGGSGSPQDKKDKGKKGGPGGPGEDKKDEDKKGPGSDPDQLGKDLDKADMEKIMMGRKAGQGIPFYIETTPALDAYYRGLSKRIPLKAAGKLPSARMPLVPLLYEPFDDEAHDVADAHMGKLYRDQLQGRLVPSVIRSKLPIDIPIRKEKRHLPDFIMSLIDSSGSMMMKWGRTNIVPWGDESYYHYALLTFYGILRFFEMERILHKLDVSAAIFSDVTLTASGLDEAKRLILNPSSGGTRLDVTKVMDCVRGRENALFSMISDGDIVNWAHVREEFIRLAKKNQFFMIQIGAQSRASVDIAAAGLPVHYVSNHKDIVKLAIDLTMQRYHAALASGAAGEAKKYKNLV